MTFRKLQEEYTKKGISLVVARNKQMYYLSIKNTPYVVQGLPEGVCQLTGYYTVYAKERLLEVDEMANKVFEEYRKQYEENPVMLSYVQ